MLCAKNLKVALAAILGVVGLVGAGTAHALIDLNSASTGDTIHQPQYFAAEKLAAETARLSAAARSPQTVIATATSTNSGYSVQAVRIPVGFEGSRGSTETVYYLRFELVVDDPLTGSVAATKASFNSEVANETLPSLVNWTLPTTETPCTAQGGDWDSTENTCSEITSGVPITSVTAKVARLSTLPGNTGIIYSMTPGAIGAGDATILWALPTNAIKVGIHSPTEGLTVYLRLSIWADRGDAEGGDFSGVRGSQAALWRGW